MLNRHELPPLLPHETVQTSGQPLIEHDIPGIVSKRLVKRHVRVPFTNDYVSVMAPATATRDECLEKHYKEQVLSTSDPMPLFYFGTGSALFTAVILSLLAIGIVIGLISLLVWIRAGMHILPMHILPLGSLW